MLRRKGHSAPAQLLNAKKVLWGWGAKGKFLSSPSPLFRQRWHQVQILGDWGGAGETSKGCHTKAILKYFFSGNSIFFSTFRPEKNAGKRIKRKAENWKLLNRSESTDTDPAYVDKRGRTGERKKGKHRPTAIFPYVNADSR